MNCISATGRIPIIAAPTAAPDDGGLGDRRVDDALLAELRDEPVGDLEGAAVDADVLAEQEDALVALPSPRGGPRGSRRRRSSGPCAGARGPSPPRWGAPLMERLCARLIAASGARRHRLDPSRRIDALERELGLTAAGSSRRPRPRGRLPPRWRWSIAASSLAEAAADSTSVARVALDRVLPAPLLELFLRARTPGRRARRGPSSGTSRTRRASGRRRSAPGRPRGAPRRRRRARRCRPLVSPGMP